MHKTSEEYLSEIVICPVCKNERKQGEMMCGVDKPICSQCYRRRNKGVKTNEM